MLAILIGNAYWSLLDSCFNVVTKVCSSGYRCCSLRSCLRCLFAWRRVWDCQLSLQYGIIVRATPMLHLEGRVWGHCCYCCWSGSPAERWGRLAGKWVCRSNNSNNKGDFHFDHLLTVRWIFWCWVLKWNPASRHFRVQFVHPPNKNTNNTNEKKKGKKDKHEETIHCLQGANAALP